jgi:hypothetical protein
MTTSNPVTGAAFICEEGFMATSEQLSHRFRVHAQHIDGHHARVLEEASFEAAAIAYAEDFAHVGAEGPDMVVIVHSLEDGHEHCFRIALETGEAKACT